MLLQTVHNQGKRVSVRGANVRTLFHAFRKYLKATKCVELPRVSTVPCKWLYSIWIAKQKICPIPTILFRLKRLTNHTPLISSYSSHYLDPQPPPRQRHCPPPFPPGVRSFERRCLKAMKTRQGFPNLSIVSLQLLIQFDFDTLDQKRGLEQRTLMRQGK